MGFAFCPTCQQAVDWILVPQTAAILRVSKRRVRQLIDEGRLPGAVKFTPLNGDHPAWRIPVASLQAHMESRNTS